MLSPTDDEVAAALAAVRCMLEQEASEDLCAAPHSAWRGAARLLAQDIAPSRMPAPSWGNVERLRRAVRGERE